MKRKRSISLILVTVVLLFGAAAAFFQFAPVVQARYPTPIYMLMPGFGLVSESVCTESNPPSWCTAGGASTGVASQPSHVEDTWQEWTVTYQDGSQSQFRSDSPQAITQNFAVAQGSSEPSILDLTVPVQLTTNNLPSYSAWDAQWATVISNIPTVSVWSNYRPLGAVSQDLLSPITFTTGDPVGTTKHWNVKIVFLGGMNYCTGLSYPCLDLSGSLNGQSAFIQIGVTIISTSYKSYTYSAGLWTSCNGQTIWLSGTSGPVTCQVGDSSTVAVPYGVNFNWSPSATGTAALTLPTGALTQCQGTYCFVWTRTGNQTFTLWSTVPVTVVGPKTTVTQAGPPIPTGGNGNGSGANNSVCQVGGGKALWGLVNIPGFTLPAWMCGKTLGINNVVWVILIVVVFIVLVALAVRPRRGSGSYWKPPEWDDYNW